MIGRIGLLVALVGCGSTRNLTGPMGTGGAGVCSTIDAGIVSPSSGSMSWKENGTPECAFSANAGLYTAAGADTIEIFASTKDATDVDILISSYSGPLGGMYTCQPGNGTTAPKAAFQYIGSHGGGLAAMSGCSVTIGFSEDSGGTRHTEGTFSGTVASDAIDGGTYDITEGMFDLTLIPTGG